MHSTPVATEGMTSVKDFLEQKLLRKDDCIISLQSESVRAAKTDEPAVVAMGLACFLDAADRASGCRFHHPGG